MTVTFYDPLTERWYPMYEAARAPVKPTATEDVHVRAERLVREGRIWDALVSSATSTRITA